MQWKSWCWVLHVWLATNLRKESIWVQTNCFLYIWVVTFCQIVLLIIKYLHKTENDIFFSEQIIMKILCWFLEYLRSCNKFIFNPKWLSFVKIYFLCRTRKVKDVFKYKMTFFSIRSQGTNYPSLRNVLVL